MGEANEIQAGRAAPSETPSGEVPNGRMWVDGGSFVSRKMSLKFLGGHEL